MPRLPRELPAKMAVHLLSDKPYVTEEKPSLPNLICEQGALSSFETGLDLQDALRVIQHDTPGLKGC